MTPWDIRFVRELESGIHEAIRKAESELGNGSQLKADAATTGMMCARYMGEIRGLNLSLLHIRQVHDAMTGKVAPKKEKAA